MKPQMIKNDSEKFKKSIRIHKNSKNQKGFTKIQKIKKDS